MKIDWFIFWAQIVNFLILLFLLRKFLYKPVIRMMKKREDDIANNIREAEVMKIEAEKEAGAFRLKNEDFEHTRNDMMKNVREEAEAQRKMLLEKARGEVSRQKSLWMESVIREQNKFMEDLRKRTSQQVLEIVRKVLNDLSERDLQQQAVITFARQLDRMNNEEKQNLQKAYNEINGEKNIIISSAFHMNEQETRPIDNAIGKNLGETVKPMYVTSDDLVLGIEMRIGGWKYSWSVEHYLQVLEEDINRMIEMEKQSEKQITGN